MTRRLLLATLILLAGAPAILWAHTALADRTTTAVIWTLLYVATAAGVAAGSARARTAAFGLGVAGCVLGAWESGFRLRLGLPAEWTLWAHGGASLVLAAATWRAIRRDRLGWALAGTSAAIFCLALGAFQYAAPNVGGLLQAALLLAVIALLGLARARGWALVVMTAAGGLSLVGAIIDHSVRRELHAPAMLGGDAGAVLLLGVIPIGLAVARALR